MEGLQIKDSYGRVIKITPLVSSIIASGLYTSPTSLNIDNSYGLDIDLPGTTPIPFSNLTVLSEPVSWNFNATLFSITFTGGYYCENWYASSDFTYYRMNSEGIMSVWVAGALEYNNINSWDKLIFTFPVVWWLPQASPSGLFTSIRIFPGVANVIYDYSASETVVGYFLYGLSTSNLGVPLFKTTILLKDWDY